MVLTVGIARLTSDSFMEPLPPPFFRRCAKFDAGAKCEPEGTKAIMEAAYKKIEDYVHVDRYREGAISSLGSHANRYNHDMIDSVSK